MQKLNINLKSSEEAVDVPNTGFIQEGGGNGSFAISIFVPTILIIFSIILIAVFIKKQRRNFSANQSFNLHKNNKAKYTSIFGLVILLSAMFVLKGNQEKPETVSAVDNTLAISVEDFTLDVVPEKDGSFAFASSVIKTTVSTEYGYILSAYTDSSDLVSSEDEKEKISSVVLTDNKPTVLTSNTWGIATTKPEDKTNAVWQALPDSSDDALIIKETNTITTAKDETKVYFGVNVNTDLKLGTYSGVVNYVIVANVAPCESNSICYNDNGANSPTTMGNQSFEASDTEVTLWASNYQRSGYGFAGWNTKTDGTGEKYGPNETISIEAGQYSDEGLSLYAMWVASAGDLQGWNGCSSLAKGAVTALKDTRDNQVYAVAKLADDNCWMIENLRLNTAGSSDRSKAQGFGAAFAGLAEAETTNFGDSTVANSLYYSGSQSGTASIDIGTDTYASSRMPRYNNDNTNNTVNRMTTTNQNIYSYGNYYTWAAAIASTGHYHVNNIAYTSLCPTGWQLPYGTGNRAGGFQYLKTAIDATTSNIFRIYPNNFLLSGKYYEDSIMISGESGYYWSSAAYDDSYSYYFGMDINESDTERGSLKTEGKAVRCVLVQE